MTQCKSLDIWKIDPSLRDSPEALRSWLEQNLPLLLGPSIDSIEPLHGAGEAVWVIRGTLFAREAADNHVAIDGAPCTVLCASESELIVRAPTDVLCGEVELQVGSHRVVVADPPTAR